MCVCGCVQTAEYIVQLHQLAGYRCTESLYHIQVNLVQFKSSCAIHLISSFKQFDELNKKRLAEEEDSQSKGQKKRKRKLCKNEWKKKAIEKE